MVATKEVHIFNIAETEKNGRQTSINEQNGDPTELRDPVYKFVISNTTYDRVMQVCLNESSIGESWIALTSQTYGYCHLMYLHDVIKQSKAEVIGGGGVRSDKVLGGDFFSVQDQIMIKITDKPNDEQFWKKTSLKFSADCKTAALITPDETFMIVLDKHERAKFLKYTPIPFLKGSLAVAIQRSSNELIFCERRESEKCLQFSSLSPKPSQDFSNLRLTCVGDVVV